MKLAISYILPLFLMLVCAMLLWSWKDHIEKFEVTQNVEDRIISMYHDVLNRQPSANELITATRDINSKTVTWDGLQQHLMDSDEYDRMVKLQSNTLTPELDKMLADSRLIREISAIYRQVRGKDVPNNVILPLRDLYTVINYNPFTLAAILKDPKYENFEQDLQRTSDLDKSVTIDKFSKTFDQTKIAVESDKIAKGPDAAKLVSLCTTNNNPQVAAANTPGATPASPANASSIGATSRTNDHTHNNPPNTLTAEDQEALKHMLEVLGASPNESVACPVDKKDTCMTPMAERIQNNASCIFNIHKAARRIEQPHKGDMVLRPEFAWSVPQQRPPVCNGLGRKPDSQPMMNSSKLLLGTPLNEASNDTQVGSIMPKFEYKEYVDVPVV